MQLKKDRTSKGERVQGFLDANAINGKDVYCFAVLVATSHHTFSISANLGVETTNSKVRMSQRINILAIMGHIAEPDTLRFVLCLILSAWG